MRHFDILHLICFALVPVLVVLYLTKPTIGIEYRDKPVSACDKASGDDKTMCIAYEACAKQGGKIEWFEWQYPGMGYNPRPKFWCGK